MSCVFTQTKANHKKNIVIKRKQMRSNGSGKEKADKKSQQSILTIGIEF